MDDQERALPIHIGDLLGDKKADLAPATKLALADAAAREALVAGLLSKDEAYRYNCYKVLLQLAEHDPASLYPFWSSFSSLLDSENSYHRMSGVTFIARLVPADTERRFEGLCEAYFAHLDDESVIVARYVAQNAARIVRARPQWIGDVTQRLLDIVRTYHNPDRRALLAADVVAFCVETRDLATDKERILTFVREQVQSSSPKTRQAAKEFLKQH